MITTGIPGIMANPASLGIMTSPASLTSLGVMASPASPSIMANPASLGIMANLISRRRCLPVPSALAWVGSRLTDNFSPHGLGLMGAISVSATA